MNAPERALAKDTRYVATRDATSPERLATVEGVKLLGQVDVRKLLVGDQILLLHVERKKGVVDQVHRHDDHETVAYLIRGRLRLVIGGQEFIAEPGTAWMHPPGVDHYSEALEDCEQLEIKSPPRKTWVSED